MSYAFSTSRRRSLLFVYADNSVQGLNFKKYRQNISNRIAIIVIFSTIVGKSVKLRNVEILFCVIYLPLLSIKYQTNEIRRN